MSKTSINPCPKCGGEISISAGQGGRGTGELTGYFAKCECGYNTHPIFSSDGTKRNALREWNDCTKEEALSFECRDKIW